MAVAKNDSIYEVSASGICWASILGGAVAALAITLVLLWFGIGMGFSVVSPWADSGVSPTTFKIGTGIYLVVVAMISSAIGGHLAGRLRNGWAGTHSNEVYFRDTANGFLSWALATIVGAALLGSAATGIIGSATGGLAQLGGTAVQSSGPMTLYIDQLLRQTSAGTSSAPSTSAPAIQNSDANDSREELTRIFTSDFRNGGTLAADDRIYVAQVVAQRTGLSQADAEKRVDEVAAKAKANMDAARKAAAQLAFWIVASLLIGAFSASIAAAEAGGFRDRNWTV